MTDPITPGIQKSITSVVKQGFVILVLLILSSMVPLMPGSEATLANGMTAAAIGRTVIAVVIVILLLRLYSHIEFLGNFYVRTLFWTHKEQPTFEATSKQIVASAIIFLYVCVLYWTLVPSVGLLLSGLTGHRWPVHIMRLVGFLVAISMMVRLYLAASPLFSNLGDELSKRLVNATESALTIKCSSCGDLNEKGAKFCKQCGSEISPKEPTHQLPSNARLCISCRAANSANAVFCSKCGKPLVEAKPNQNPPNQKQ